MTDRPTKAGESHAILGSTAELLHSPDAIDKVIKSLSRMPVSNESELYLFLKSFERAVESGACRGWRTKNDTWSALGWNEAYFLNIASQGKDFILAEMQKISGNIERSAPLLFLSGDPTSTTTEVVVESGKIPSWVKDEVDPRSRVVGYDKYASSPADTKGEPMAGISYCTRLAKVLRKKRTEVKWNYQVPFLLRPKSLGVLAVGGIVAWLAYAKFGRNQ